MDFSLFFFADDGAAGADGYRLLLESARFADEHGFTAVWTPERHFHTFGGPYPNPAVVGAAVAAVTERIGIRAGSVVAPLHHPARIAEEWSVVDNLSRGRVGVSFASGWLAADFVLRPDGYADRKRLTLETMDTVQRLWRGEEVQFPDENGGQRAIRIRPTPVQPQLPVWLTSAGTPDTFRTAGRLGAGLLTHLLGQGIDTLAGNIAEYRREAANARGDFDASGGTPGIAPRPRPHVTLMLHTLLGDDRAAVRELVREPFSNYLRSSADLVLKASAGLLPAGFDPQRLSNRDKQALIAHAFQRYFDTGGLFGTVADGVAVARRLAEIGVDEIACLIDFGVPADEVLRSLKYVVELRDAVDAIMGR
jgi:natural product biosynthesis luciferase-like monooxygenase protein